MKAKRRFHEPSTLDLELAKIIEHTLKKEQLTQTAAAEIMGTAPSQVSLVVTRKLRGFSTERLLDMVQRLGYTGAVTLRRAGAATHTIILGRPPRLKRPSIRRTA